MLFYRTKIKTALRNQLFGKREIRIGTGWTNELNARMVDMMKGRCVFARAEYTEIRRQDIATDVCVTLPEFERRKIVTSEPSTHHVLVRTSPIRYFAATHHVMYINAALKNMSIACAYVTRRL